MTTYRSKAPLRIGLAGGGTDVSPFSDLYGGAILNATISLYAYASLTPRDDDKIVIHAIDRGERLECSATDFLDPSEGPLKLQKGVYNRIVQDYLHRPHGFELITSIDVSAGSGLGTSSTLLTAILGAFSAWLRLPLGEYDLAQLAYDIERVDLKMAGGKQDQYAAIFGGVNFMEFYAGNRVVVNPLRIREEIIEALNFHLLLLYTQTTRESANIIERQQKNIEGEDQAALEATRQLKAQAYEMKEALLKNEINNIGEILRFGWEQKRQIANGITNPFIDGIYETAVNAGASGGKISGAGGGGYMIFFCPGNCRFQVIDALREIGVHVQPYTFVNKGLYTWTS
ncbi:dehydrogenase [Neolewinella lacunae]|uniref:Dehydrogenase n=1 Tax=Neolewinella lacunae TaxID=1517758 RepID=A0A923PRS8_9BACT|nr:dehydrogenase [Neolewinella lacunae]MBC6996288.1 dehydrogenase [Neolewinella lacunae]MDN3636911.1 dehydrogenase [Neolewinella lacunae]